MNKSDIEMISAFLDNELSEIERKDFEKRLSTDEKFALTFANYSENDQVLRQALSKIDNTPVPNRILEMLEGAKSNTLANNENIVQLSSWRSSKWLAVAAAFLVFTLAVPVLLTMNKPATITLVSLLDSQVSGQTIALDESTNVELVMSFNDTQGQFCREYVISQSTSSVQTVACKIDGAWKPQVSAALAMNSENNFQPASGAGSHSVETWLDLNMQGIPMSTQSERENLTQPDH